MAKHNNASNKKSLIFLLVAGILILLLANLLPKIQVYIKRPEAAAVLKFPKDHASHSNYRTEWWYLNLLTRTSNLQGADQKDSGYLLSFSRIDKVGGLLNSKYDNNSKEFKQNTDFGGNLQAYLNNQKYLFVSYTNRDSYATLEERRPGSDGRKIYKLSGKTPEIGTFNLTLKERTKSTEPLLWGGNSPNCRGRISVFAPNDTYYYSIPNLDITGTITDIDGVTRNVKIGKAWIDHQWLNSAPPADWKGHYWTNFHFTHSDNLYNTAPHQAVGFVTQIYNSGPKYTYWVKRDADGTNQCGTTANIAIGNYDSTNYPSSWTINLQKSGGNFLELNGIASSDNQIIDPPGGLPAFFEPASSYTGKLNGRSINGLGFFETHLKRPQ
ncbi:MAG: hypothetical protein HY426_03645 [Candidatus Levybacteria bacterium]|nr:hypothetical protein [Candidatus Levybacteria bacterium]